MRGRRRERSEDSELHKEWRWIGGLHAVEETLRGKPRSVRELLIDRDLRGASIADMVKRGRKGGARVVFVPRAELDHVVPGGRHQGVAAKVIVPTGGGLKSFIAGLSEKEKSGMVLAALDQIQDPHNLGAIARSAVNLGARALIVPERRSSPVTPAAIQASAGAIQRLPVFPVVNLAQALSHLKDAGFWVYGADAAGAPVWDTVLNLPLVLVIGSEGYGMRPLVKSLCNELVSIPQSEGGVASLNASCAASVLFYEIARQRAARE